MGAAKPTVDDVVGWLRLQTPPSADMLAVYGEAFDAALEDVESIISNTFVLASGDGDLTDADNYPQRVRTAVIVAAAKLAKRSSTPDGMAGFGGDGLVVRVSGIDPDVERLVHKYLRVDGWT